MTRRAAPEPREDSMSAREPKVSPGNPCPFLRDRAPMNGEWPVLLKVMGKAGARGRYLSLAELRDLVEHRRLPARMQARLAP